MGRSVLLVLDEPNRSLVRCQLPDGFAAKPLENKKRTLYIGAMQSTSALLSRRPHRPPPSVSLFEGAALPLARVHEICGRARRTLALMVAAKAGAPVLWISPAWGADPINPDGMAQYLEPRDVLFVHPRRGEDVLWCMEETLRAGCVPVVIADLPEPPPLTPVRRLHLAAEAGCGAGQCRPLGLLLTPGTGGAPGVETRWSLDPAHEASETRWRLARLRARMAPPRDWTVRHSTSGLAPEHPAPEQRLDPMPAEQNSVGIKQNV